MQGFPYIKQLPGVDVVLNKEGGGCGAAQEAILTPRDPHTAASCLGMDGTHHRKWGKIPQKEGG